MWSTGRSEAALEASLPAPIEIRHLRSARRLRLRYDEAKGTLKLTCPSRTSRRQALSWALDQLDWIEAQLARAGPMEPFEDGRLIPFHGEEIRIVWDVHAARMPTICEGQLRLGGTGSSISRRVETFLRRLALETMSREVAEYAAKLGVSVAGVTVGDAGSRWGSCSSQRRIRLSWRLILAPQRVRRYVVAHEVAHLAYLDHSAEFKKVEAALFGPGLAEAKAELRRIGPRLRRVGRLG